MPQKLSNDLPESGHLPKTASGPKPTSCTLADCQYLSAIELQGVLMSLLAVHNTAEHAERLIASVVPH